MKILFLINKSRRDEGPEEAIIDQMRQTVENAGLDCNIVISSSIDESESAINAALRDGTEALWIGGGDGTLNHALNFTYGRDLAYGIIPMGTVNALARSLGVPLDPLEAVQYLLTARPTPMDVGLLSHSDGKKYFFTYATVGIHAAIFHNIDSSFKKRWGQLAFWDSAVRTLWNKSRLPRFSMEMQLATSASPADSPDSHSAAPDKPVRDSGYSFTLSNVANYAGYATFTNSPAASPGYFYLHHFRRNKIMPMLVSFIRLRIFGKDVSRPQAGTLVRQVQCVKVNARRKLSVQVDGEPVKPSDRRQFQFECLPGGASILLQPPAAAALTEEPVDETAIN